MKTVKGVWLGDERVVNGLGRVTAGPVDMPEHLAKEFTQQGLFKATPIKQMKETSDVRADD